MQAAETDSYKQETHAQRNRCCFRMSSVWMKMGDSKSHIYVCYFLYGALCHQVRAIRVILHGNSVTPEMTS